MVEHLTYSIQHYDQLAPEACKITDEILNEWVVRCEEALPSMPDSPGKRQLKRSIKGIKGKRLHAQSLLQVLESPVDPADTKLRKSRELFERGLQQCLDFLQDIVETTKEGPASYCQLGLFSVCIDELLAAFHFSQRAHTAQALSHMRTFQESLDLIMLFQKDSQWVDLWVSDKPWQEVWKELSPGKVHEKLSQDPVYRKMYGLFSQVGSHPTFQLVRTRSLMQTAPSEKGHVNIRILIGGAPNTKESFFCHFCVAMSLVRLMSQMIICFEGLLNGEEIRKAMNETIAAFADLMVNEVLKPYREAGLDISELDTEFQKMSEGFNEVFGGPPSP